MPVKQTATPRRDTDSQHSLPHRKDAPATPAAAEHPHSTAMGGYRYVASPVQRREDGGQPASDVPPVQRVVLSRVYDSTEKGKTITKYYSTYDSKTVFDTYDDAYDHDKKLRDEAGKLDRDSRYPTNFTYHQTESRDAIPPTNQGPHSLSHSSLAHRLDIRFGSDDFDLQALRDEQVLSKKDFKDSFGDEAPSGMKLNRSLRANTDYGLLYDELDSLLNEEDYDEDLAYELIMRLMQMNPYTAYGKKKQGKKRMKFKNERKEDPFSKAFDTNAKFNSSEGYEGFKEMRKKLYPVESESDDENSEQELSEEDIEGEQLRKKVKTETPSVRAVVHLETLADVKKRGWNVGDRFEVDDQPDIYYVWTTNHIEGTEIQKGDIKAYLKGG